MDGVRDACVLGTFKEGPGGQSDRVAQGRKTAWEVSQSVTGKGATTEGLTDPQDPGLDGGCA